MLPGPFSSIRSVECPWVLSSLVPVFSTNPHNAWYPNVQRCLLKKQRLVPKQGYPGNRRLSCDLERKGKGKKKNTESAIRRKIVTVTWMDAGYKKGFESLMMTNSGSSPLKGSAVSQSDMQCDKKLVREERNMWACCFYYNWAISSVDMQKKGKNTQMCLRSEKSAYKYSIIVSPAWTKWRLNDGSNDARLPLHSRKRHRLPLSPTQWWNSWNNSTAIEDEPCWWRSQSHGDASLRKSCRQSQCLFYVRNASFSSSFLEVDACSTLRREVWES